MLTFENSPRKIEIGKNNHLCADSLKLKFNEEFTIFFCYSDIKRECGKNESGICGEKFDKVEICGYDDLVSDSLSQNILFNLALVGNLSMKIGRKGVKFLKYGKFTLRTTYGGSFGELIFYNENNWIFQRNVKEIWN